VRAQKGPVPVVRRGEESGWGLPLSLSPACLFDGPDRSEFGGATPQRRTAPTGMQFLSYGRT
jgi:hypothetical protein